MISKTKSKKSFAKLLLSLACVLCMAFSVVIPVNAEAANASVTKVSESLVQVRMIYKKDSRDKGTPIQGGTGFLINGNTVLTCAHVVDVNDDVKAICKDIFGSNYSIDNLSLEVVVSGDVTIPVKVKKESQEMDFAIVNLTEMMNRRTPAVLGDSDSVDKTQVVYALGFPAAVAELQNKNTYTSDDVTITSGEVSKITSSDGIDYIQHGAILNNGNSGGPLVNENGEVVGINKGTKSNYYYSVSMNQVKNILDELGVEYQSGTGASVSKGETVAPETEEQPTTEAVAPATEKQEATTTAVASTDKNNDNGDSSKMIIIIAIAAVAVIIIIVVIIIIASGSKKKSKPVRNVPNGPSGTNRGPSAYGNQPQPNRGSSPYGNQPQQSGAYRPNVPSQGAAPTVPNNEGAGQTTVLNEGAGETTVLGYQPTGAVLVRTSTNERISINKPEFVIGKERRRVDYCISNNNSVSRAHAKIKVRAGKFFISDLGSTNCTYVNGNKLTPNQEVALSNGDKIKISDEEFQFMG